MARSLLVVAAASVLLFFLIAPPVVLASTLSPVVFVPGTGGNQLEARLNKPTAPHWYCSKKHDWFRLWLDTKNLLPGAIDCWADNIRLVLDPTSQRFGNSPGVETRVPGWGTTDGFEYLDPSLKLGYGKKMVDALVAAGYVRGESLRGAPYDFRHSPYGAPELYTKLEGLIEDTYTRNENVAVTLLAHSMGGLVSQHFLAGQSAEWKTKYIAQYISLGTPYLGAHKVTRLFASGDNEGIPFVSALSIRGEQRSYESNFWMLPLETPSSKDTVIVRTPQRSYTIAQIRDFIASAHPEGLAAYDLVRAVTDKRPAPGVTTHCFYGTGSDTPASFEYKGSYDDTPMTTDGDGDGTVTRDSATACAAWKDEQAQTVSTVDVPGVAHADLVGDPTVVKQLLALLQR